jgi:hypothetical protein
MRKTIILLLIFLSNSYSQHGVGSNWQNEVLIPKYDTSKNQRGVLFNNLAVSPSGRIFLLTTESNPSSGLISGCYLYYSDDNGNNWSSPKLFQPMQLVIGPSPMKLVFGTDNNLHLLWNAKNPAAVFYSRYDYNLNLLIDTIRIASKVLYNDFATHFTVDRNGRLHAIWHEGNTGSNQTAEVYYGRSTNGGLNWSVQRLSNMDGKHSAFPRAQFEACSGDTLAIAWRDSVSSSGSLQNWDVYMCISTNGGINWSAPFAAASTSDYESDPDIVIDDLNNIHLFYHVYPVGNPFDGANIKYKMTSNLGINWVNMQQLSELNKRSHLLEGERYDPVRNILWAMWKDERDFSGGNAKADIIITYSTNRGISWSVPEFGTDKGDSTVGYKAASLLPNGDYIMNYESGMTVNNSRVFFRRRTISTIGINHSNNQNPVGFALYQNYPNPFNPVTSIKFDIPKQQFVKLVIYDINGREVEILLNKSLSHGSYSIQYNASNLSSGVYFYRLETDNGFADSKKMIVAK